MIEVEQTQRPFWLDMVILGFAAIIFITLLGLGTWQVQRLSWKLELIETVEARAFGPPVMPPRYVSDAQEHIYQRVVLSGTFSHDLTQRVKAVTELGPGSWIMTPLMTDNGTFWINRGFAPTGLTASEIDRPAGNLSISGLLRASEPNGTLLEKNDPVHGRWFSRDLAELSDAVGIEPAEGYFIDADHVGADASWPRGGLTKLVFRNNHLAYAITWYAMAMLFLAAIVCVIGERLRQSAAKSLDPMAQSGGPS
ncbi:MAG: SURF1 family protein [Pseudomonadota bacterium]